MSSLSNKLAGKNFPFEDVSFCFDGALNAELADAKAAYAEAKATDAERLAANSAKAAKKRLDAVIERVQASLITLRITAVPFGEYNKFIIQNPPRKGKEETLNPETFYIFVARRTGKYVEDDGTLSEISPEQWDEIEASFTDGDHDRLAFAVSVANRKNRADGIDFLSSNSAETVNSSENSEPQEALESPTDV